MKKKVFVLVILVFFLALSSVFSQDLTITVTGIPETYNGKYGSIALFKAGSTADVVALSQNVKISRGKVTMDLIDYAELDKGNLKVFAIPGRYTLFFDLYETDKANSKIADSGGMSLDKAVSGGDNVFDFAIFN